MTQRLSSHATGKNATMGLKNTRFFTCFSSNLTLFHSLHSNQTRFQKTGHQGKSGIKNNMMTGTDATRKDDDLWDDKKKRTVNPRT